METVSRRSTWAVVKWSVVCTAKKGFVDAFYNLSLVAVGYPKIFRSKARDQSTLFRIIEQESRGEAIYIETSSQGYSKEQSYVMWLLPGVAKHGS